MNTPTSVATSPPAAVAEDTKLGGRRAALLISTLLLGVLSFQLNASMVTPALPQIAASFGLSAESAAPVQSMFFLAGAIAGPVIGRWSDFIGRRTALLLVLGIMGAGTILCIAAPTLPHPHRRQVPPGSLQRGLRARLHRPQRKPAGPRLRHLRGHHRRHQRRRRRRGRLRRRPHGRNPRLPVHLRRRPRPDGHRRRLHPQNRPEGTSAGSARRHGLVGRRIPVRVPGLHHLLRLRRLSRRLDRAQHPGACSPAPSRPSPPSG